MPADKADAYHDYLLATGVPDYQGTPGNRGVYVFRRTEGETVHFLLLTLWDSLDAIRAFAGDDVDRARYYPEDAVYLVELEPTVTHYDVLASPRPHTILRRRPAPPCLPHPRRPWPPARPLASPTPSATR